MHAARWVVQPTAVTPIAKNLINGPFVAVDGLDQAVQRWIEERPALLPWTAMGTFRAHSQVAPSLISCIVCDEMACQYARCRPLSSEKRC